MPSAVDQFAAQEKIAAALARQMEGQLAEPLAPASSQDFEAILTNKQRLIQRQKVSQAKEVVVLGGKELDCSHKQQQKQEQRQFLGEGQGEGRSGPGFERGPGPAVDSDTPSGSDDDSNEDPESRKARKKLRRACDYCTRKKVRCDGSRPCRQCQRKEVECKFSICQRSGPRASHHSDSTVNSALVVVVADWLASTNETGSNTGPSPQPQLSLQACDLPDKMDKMDKMIGGNVLDRATGDPGSAAASQAAAATASATAAGAALGGAGPPATSQMAMMLSGGGITSKVDVTYLNFFLKEFNAFVPLTTQAILRDALNPTPAALTNKSPGGDEEYRRHHARVTVIQGCITVGALIKGGQTGGQTQIVHYMRNVREALMTCFDFVSAETMTAFMVLAYCHDLMGNAAATRNYMEFAKAIASQLPQVTVDDELVFQFYRVCSEIHNCTLSATPKLLQQAGAPAPCYQVLNVLTYALYDLAHLAKEELASAITRQQVTAELQSLHPILARADGMSRDNASSFGALGMVLVKGTLAYVLLRLGRSQEGLEILEPVVDLLSQNPGLLRQVMCWHLTHCVLVIFLEHGWFKEYEVVRGLYNRLLQPEKGGQHFPLWRQGHFQDATPFPPVERLHSHGNSFLCSNPICKVVNRDLSDGVDVNVPSQQQQKQQKQHPPPPPPPPKQQQQQQQQQPPSPSPSPSQAQKRPQRPQQAQEAQQAQERPSQKQQQRQQQPQQQQQQQNQQKEQQNHHHQQQGTEVGLTMGIGERSSGSSGGGSFPQEGTQTTVVNVVANGGFLNFDAKTGVSVTSSSSLSSSSPSNANRRHVNVAEKTPLPTKVEGV